MNLTRPSPFSCRSLPPNTNSAISGGGLESGGASDRGGSYQPRPSFLLSKKSPRQIVIQRSPSDSVNSSSGSQGFGFTLRHFIVYPPEVSGLLIKTISLCKILSRTQMTLHFEANEPLSLNDKGSFASLKNLCQG